MDPVETAASAELKELGDIPTDDVLAILDRELPSYRELYYRWEHQQWEAGAIDFPDDRLQWAELPDDLRTSLAAVLASVSVDAEGGTHALIPFVDAAPTEEQHVFLTTQLADAGRHAVFFQRVSEEVMESSLPGDSGRILGHLGEVSSLAERIALLHVGWEGIAAPAIERFLLDFLRERDLLQGIRQGLTAVCRDHVRHAAFGLLFLKEALLSEPLIERSIRAQLDVSIDADETLYAVFPYGPDELAVFARDLRSRRVKAIGLAD